MYFRHTVTNPINTLAISITDIKYAYIHEWYIMSSEEGKLTFGPKVSWEKLIKHLTLQKILHSIEENKETN